MKRPKWGLHAPQTLLMLVGLCVGAVVLVVPGSPLVVGGPQISQFPPASLLTPDSASFYASPNPTDANFGTTFSSSGVCQATLTGCSYTYSGLPPGCGSEDTDQLSCTPTMSGTYVVGVTATALCVGTCLQWSNETTLVVNGDVNIQSISASASAVDLGQSLTFTLTAEYGTSPLSYNWANLPSGCVSANTSSLTCSPTGTGSFGVSGEVVDAVGSQANRSVEVTVAPHLQISSFVINPSQTGVLGPVTLTVGYTGGVAPYTFSYTSLPSGCSSTDAASFSCNPSQSGTFSVGVVVSDNGGETATDQATLVVDSGPSITSATWGPTGVEVGHSSVLTVVASGGTTPYTYSYSNLPPGCSSSDSSTLSCTPTQSGTYDVNVTVQDAHGLSAYSRASLTVGSTLSVSFTDNRSGGTAPLVVAFNSVVSGGTGPYSYAWVFGDGSTSSQSNPSHTFGTVGNFTVNLTVTDSMALSGSFARSIRVAAPTGTNYPLTLVISPASCGPVTVGTLSADNGTVLQLPAASYRIVAPPCPGETFSYWLSSGATSIVNPSQSSASVGVTGPGSLTASYVTGGGGGNPGPTTGHGVVFSPLVRTLTLVVALVAAVWGLMYLGRRRTHRNSPSRGPTVHPPSSPSSPRGSGGSSLFRGANLPPPASYRPPLGPLPSVPPGALRGAGAGKPPTTSAPPRIPPSPPILGAPPSPIGAGSSPPVPPERGRSVLPTVTPRPTPQQNPAPAVAGPGATTAAGPAANGNVEVLIQDLVDELLLAGRSQQHLARARELLRRREIGSAQEELDRAAIPVRDSDPARLLREKQHLQT